MDKCTRWDSIVDSDNLAKIVKMHPTTIRRLALEGKIPCMRIGQAIRFDVESVIKKLSQ
jgi:hypothetical protein